MANANLVEWRKAQEEGEPFTLPSGLQIRVKKWLSVLDVVSKGDLPMPLVGAARDFAMMGFNLPRFDFEKMPEHLEVLGLIVSAALIHPRVTAEPSDETITINELTTQERLLIYAEVCQEGELMPFREKPTTDETHRKNGTEEQHTSERPARSRA